MSRAAAEVGATANSYQILAKLATGGMAEIFLARGEAVAGVERYCVLKRILHDRASDVHFVRMFLDEARLAAQLQHPNIAQVYDIGKLGDSYFFTMEYVHGETVRALLHRAQVLRRWLPVHGVLTIVAGAAAGLHHAHTRIGRDGRALGIVHRDVSPSNLMVSYEGGVKVVDFGVAKAADSSSETRSGTVKGKISYLSPEQCKGRRVDRRADLYSLGICFWEMLATERLYKRPSDFENMNAIVSEPTPPPSSRRADVSRELDELVLRLLAKEPDDRFQSAEELVEAIEEVASQTGALLSSSALGRFVRELFGQRPEPWLELAAQSEREPVTVTSEPIPVELAIPPADAVNRQLAGVIDLSERVATESLGSSSGQGPMPAVPSSGRVTVPMRSATPRPEAPLGLPPELALGTRAGTSLSAAPLPPIPTGPGTQAPRAPGPPLPPESYVMPAPPGSFASSPSLSGSPAQPPGTLSPITPLPGALTPVPAAPPPLVQPAGAHMAAVGPFVSPASTHGSMPAAAAYRGRRWSPYVVISTAAIVGSVAVIVMMRSGAGGQESAAAVRSAPAVVEPKPPEVKAPEGKPAGPAIVEQKPAEQKPAPAEQKPAPAEQKPAPAEPKPAGSTVAEPPAREPTVAEPPGANPGSPSSKAVPPRATGGHTPARRDPPDDDLSHLLVAGRHDKIVEKCSAGPVSAERAPFCVIAACHSDSEAKARRLIAAVPPSKRDQLIEYCKQLGIDIAATKKPAKPAVDCDADPMACQH